MTSGKTHPKRPAGEGLGGLLSGLGDLINLAERLAEQGEHATTGEREFTSPGGSRGVYGFSVRTGIGGTPTVERFGNVRDTTEGPVVSDTREPLRATFSTRAKRSSSSPRFRESRRRTSTLTSTETSWRCRRRGPSGSTRRRSFSRRRSIRGSSGRATRTATWSCVSPRRRVGAEGSRHGWLTGTRRIAPVDLARRGGASQGCWPRDRPP